MGSEHKVLEALCPPFIRKLAIQKRRILEEARKFVRLRCKTASYVHLLFQHCASQLVSNIISLESTSGGSVHKVLGDMLCRFLKKLDCQTKTAYT